MIVIGNPEGVELTELDHRFIELVNNRITSYGQIPYTVPPRLIIDMIIDCAKYFYKHSSWRYSQISYWYLDKKDIERYIIDFGEGDRKSQSYSVVLPGNIRNVLDMTEPGESMSYMDVDSGEGSSRYEFSGGYGVSSPIFHQNSAYGQTLMGINQMLYVTSRAVKMVENAAMQSIFFQTVPYNFNITTKRLTIHKNITKSFVLKCNVDIPLQYLYEDETFRDYVIANVKKELKRVLAGHTFELPGGVAMNADDICDNLDIIDDIKQKLRDSSGIGDIIMIR